jgi:uncharacterized membrane protein
MEKSFNRHNDRVLKLVALHELLLEQSFYPLVLCTMLCFSFILTRRIGFGHAGYPFLVKNLFLAWMPYVLSMGALWFHRTQPHRRYRIAAIWTAWLALLPNAPYLFTDLIHWRRWNDAPWWFDLGMFLMFALAGCFCGIASLRIMHDLARGVIGEVGGWLFVMTASVLTGFGIYLGRFERWNSWWVLTRPRFVLSQLAHGLADPFSHSRPLGVTLMFGAMTLACYVMCVSMARGTTPACDTSRPVPFDPTSRS